MVNSLLLQGHVSLCIFRSLNVGNSTITGQSPHKLSGDGVLISAKYQYLLKLLYEGDKLWSNKVFKVHDLLYVVLSSKIREQSEREQLTII
ncbi:hypothetical protein DPMN_157665 [Dreissena polymorpha]|uniref:Uncharacterized protein n=1 Tax=Dreissena polymorpha TaxID=45954 RepID=A0A9D4IP25_DREPO|nr:hypothetical protein DPMN_157665 [Dreissena polymorpha]